MSVFRLVGFGLVKGWLSRLIYSGFRYSVNTEKNEECNYGGRGPIDVREYEIDDELAGDVPANVKEDVVDVFKKGTKTNIGDELL